jgi:hypothetical protein
LEMNEMVRSSGKFGSAGLGMVFLCRGRNGPLPTWAGRMLQTWFSVKKL